MTERTTIARGGIRFRHPLAIPRGLEVLQVPLDENTTLTFHLVRPGTEAAAEIREMQETSDQVPDEYNAAVLRILQLALEQAHRAFEDEDPEPEENPLPENWQGQKDECPICMDMQDDVATLSCGYHKLCSGCYQKLEKLRCPFCNRLLDSVEL